MELRAERIPGRVCGSIGAVADWAGGFVGLSLEVVIRYEAGGVG